MTPDQYRAKIKMLGLTPARPSYDGAQIYQTRDNEFVNVPNPETLSAEERVDVLQLIIDGNGLSFDH